MTTIQVRHYLTRASDYLALAAEWDRRVDAARSLPARTNAQAVATSYRHLAVANRVRSEGPVESDARLAD